jgi:hypothetical protein
VRLVAQQEKPVASPQVMGLTAGGESDLSVETINRDRSVNLVTGHLMVFAEHHPDGLKCVFLHQRKGGGRGARCSLGLQIDGPAWVRVLWWVCSCHD